jgi:glutamate synthase (ferredoxin)
MIERHFELTGSERADEILGNWEVEKEKFWQIYPPSESKTSVVTSVDAVQGELRVSASAPDGDMCFLPVGAEMSPEQTQRCAD